MINKTDISSMTLQELEGLAEALGEKKFRGRQIFAWLHSKLATDFGQMSDLPSQLRWELANRYSIITAKVLSAPISSENGMEEGPASFRTKKYLLEVENQNIIESVLMRYEYGTTLCVSTQAGCRMGCVFCASTLDGLERNLAPGEMSAQLAVVTRDTGERISNIVLMGCGEPFDNFDNVVKFLENTINPAGLNLSQRAITVSTCGIVPRIKEFARLEKSYGLAVSLHAPNDVLRKEIMPIAKAYDLKQLMGACDEYTKITNRRISYEYSMIQDKNDQIDHAHELGRLLRGRLAHVNLIPLNSVEERGLKAASRKRLGEFIEILRTYRVRATPRTNLGQDINAACGQLRASVLAGR